MLLNRCDEMKYCKVLLCMTALVCLAFQAYAQSDPLGESARGTDQARDEMVGWLNQTDPLPTEVTKSTTTATSTTPSPDVTKSTTTVTSSAPGNDAKSTTTTTSSTPATEPTTTSKSTTTTTTPGFEAIFAVAGLLAVTFVALRRRD